MKVLIQKQYEIELVEFQQDENHFALKVAYSMKQYPGLISTMQDFFMKHEPISIQWAQGDTKAILDEFGFGWYHLPEDTPNDVPPGNTYGELAKGIPPEKRKEFVMTHACGEIKGHFIEIHGHDIP